MALQAPVPFILYSVVILASIPVSISQEVTVAAATTQPNEEVILKIVDVYGRDLNGVRLHPESKMMAIAQLTDAQTGLSLRSKECDAVIMRTGEHYPILGSGCGDGVILSQDAGFFTDGPQSATSPLFGFLDLHINDTFIQLECTFDLCFSNCNGDSCEASRILGISPDIILGTIRVASNVIEIGRESATADVRRSSEHPVVKTRSDSGDVGQQYMAYYLEVASDSIDVGTYDFVDGERTNVGMNRLAADADQKLKRQQGVVIVKSKVNHERLLPMASSWIVIVVLSILVLVIVIITSCVCAVRKLSLFHKVEPLIVKPEVVRYCTKADCDGQCNMPCKVHKCIPFCRTPCRLNISNSSAKPTCQNPTVKFVLSNNSSCENVCSSKNCSLGFKNTCNIAAADSGHSCRESRTSLSHDVKDCKSLSFNGMKAYTNCTGSSNGGILVQKLATVHEATTEGKIEAQDSYKVQMADVSSDEEFGDVPL